MPVPNISTGGLLETIQDTSGLLGRRAMAVLPHELSNPSTFKCSRQSFNPLIHAAMLFISAPCHSYVTHGSVH